MVRLLLTSVSITDVCRCYRLEMTRHVSMISISLSPKELNKNSPGYSFFLASSGDKLSSTSKTMFSVFQSDVVALLQVSSSSAFRTT